MESLTEASRLRKGCPDGYPSLSIARLLCSIMNAGSGDFRTPVTHDQKGFRPAKAQPTSHPAISSRALPHTEGMIADRRGKHPRARCVQPFYWIGSVSKPDLCVVYSRSKNRFPAATGHARKALFLIRLRHSGTPARGPVMCNRPEMRGLCSAPLLALASDWVLLNRTLK
jgi:hypothetical protein